MLSSTMAKVCEGEAGEGVMCCSNLLIATTLLACMQTGAKVI